MFRNPLSRRPDGRITHQLGIDLAIAKGPDRERAGRRIDPRERGAKKGPVVADRALEVLGEDA